VTAAKTAGVCLVLAGIALAGPSFRIGTKLTWHDGSTTSELSDSTGTPLALVSYDKTFVGPTVEASYGPLWNVLSGRIDLAQVSFFTSGGRALRLAPMLGLSLMVEPPTQWRVKPYGWVGLQTTRYAGMPYSSLPEFQHDEETHWRGGLGVKYRLTPQIDLLAETQWYADDTWWDGVQVFQGTWIASWTKSGASGLVGAEIGVRFALGK